MLLRFFPFVAAVAARVFYRLHVSGARVPPTGPVLLAANHPNSLLDPLLTVAAARRPVRFLAKAPLFHVPLVKWAVRAVGAIPIYRRRDDPTQVRRNEETFRAVFSALAAGNAVGIFPEGISHDEPALVPLKTGVARIALGAAATIGHSFPIVPIGLVLEAKEEFRSNAYVLVGDVVRWDDLARLGPDDPAAVRELTARITQALSFVTLNYLRREDATLVTAATAVYGAEFGDVAEPHELIARRMSAARVLAYFHVEGDPEAAALARTLERHMRTLAILGLSPADLHRRRGEASSWLREFSPTALATGLIAALGTVLFWVPYRLTGVLAERGAAARDVIAMNKLLYGVGLFTLWIVALAVALWNIAGWMPGVAGLLLLPILALATLSYGERWAGGLRDVRSVFVVRDRTEAVAALCDQQRALANRLREFHGRAQLNDSALSSA